jgi:DNA-binding transcriptional MocR family regulator
LIVACPIVPNARRDGPGPIWGPITISRQPVPATDFVRILADWSRREGPLYLRLADRIGDLIDEGALPGNVLLPSERALAKALAVSRGTVETAYDVLKSRELIARKTGVGTWATPQTRRHRSHRRRAASDSFVEFLLSGSRTLDLTVAGLPAHELVLTSRRATRARVDELQRGTHGYLASGLDELKEHICAWFGRLGIPTTSDQVAITSGAAQALWLAASLLTPGSNVVVENPTSPTILTALRAHPLQIHGAPADQRGLVVKAVPPDLRDAIFLTPAYLNPTGAHLSRHRCEQLSRCAEQGVLVVEDLALIDIRLGGPPPRTIAAAAPQATILSIGSMSKLYSAGLRGWLRAPAPVIRRVNHIKAMLDISSPVETQAQAAWLLERHEELLERHEELCSDRLPQLRTQRDEMVELLASKLPQWRTTVPDGGLSLWLELPGDSSSLICQRMLRDGIRMLPSRGFDAQGLDERHLRLPFVVPPRLSGVIVDRLAATAMDS